ncbi:MAG: hypothetical protein M0D54_05310 [Hyphomonadaceae bacterium JAD_PAG50586_4]|nr:MAG: hypothetical protein M0D54_05310 [Hyphomonadaceae bacterium JAD_PAG50586_4]
MSIASIGASSLGALLALGRSKEIADQQAFQPPVGALSEAASPAASGTILPAANTSLGLSFETILSLQSLDEVEPTQLVAQSATQKFLEEARKSPIERMREQIMEELGLTEDSLSQLAPDEKRAMEDKIAQMIEEKLRQGMGGEQGADTDAGSMIELVA